MPHWPAFEPHGRVLEPAPLKPALPDECLHGSYDLCFLAMGEPAMLRHLQQAEAPQGARAAATQGSGQRVLANTRAAAIPTIVVSGAVSPGDIERLYADLGVLAFHEKQAFDRRAFARTVEDALARVDTVGDGLALLTQREREVLALLAKGLTNKEIAARLVISPNTVKRHLKAVFEKLSVSTRAAAAAKAAGME